MKFAYADSPRRLYELECALWRDIPFGITGTDRSFESWRAEELNDSEYLPAATFIALLDNRWIGLCALGHHGSFLASNMTGVR